MMTKKTLVELECLVLSPGSVLGLNPTKAFGFSVEGWCALKKKRKLPLRN